MPSSRSRIMLRPAGAPNCHGTATNSHFLITAKSPARAKGGKTEEKVPDPSAPHPQARDLALMTLWGVCFAFLIAGLSFFVLRLT